LSSIKEEIFRINSQESFVEPAIRIFQYQAEKCEPYRRYLELLDCDPLRVRKIEDIPFLPIQLFKTEKIYCGDSEAEMIFTSSSTTGMTPSRHYVADLSLYEKSFTEGFRLQYGDVSQYAILALLPSYLERTGSSLIYMADSLMRQSGNESNGYYLYNHGELYEMLETMKKEGQKTILIGVSFALLDFVANHECIFPSLILIETGGMKGRGIELSRDDIHSHLKKAFGVENVHSEYGMAELLSQAYSSGAGIFSTPPWMKVIIRDLNNPFRKIPEGTPGGINIIDLANAGSCSFIETQDLGTKTAGDHFKILGRIKDSELRGCNLLIG